MPGKFLLLKFRLIKSPDPLEITLLLVEYAITLIVLFATLLAVTK